jgi:hypothetical protein
MTLFKLSYLNIIFICVLHISCCICLFFLWHLGILGFSMYNLTIDLVIFNDHFKKLALCMSCIVIFCKIMSLIKEHKHDNVTYML